MKLPHRRQFLHLAAAAVVPTMSCPAKAQAYPSRPVRIFVGFPPGGAADTIVRILAQWFTDQLGQPFFIENRPGAATNLSVQAAMAAPADGYTIVFVGTSTAINVSLYEKSAVNFTQDGSGIGAIATFPHIIAGSPKLPAKDIAELIAYARSNPGKINAASYGTGTTSHLAIELLKSMGNINITHVPYRGDTQTFLDLISGRIDIYVGTFVGTLPQIRSGAVRGIAVLDKTRSSEAPDIPAVAEAVPGYVVESVGGFGVRKGTAPQIINRLNAVLNDGLRNPVIRTRLAELSVVPVLTTPAEFDASMAAQTEKWAKVIRAANIKPE